MRRTFNLKERIPMFEDDLRRKIGFWLELASRKLENSAVLDSSINVVFEHVELLREEDKNKTSLIKHWMPETFPARVNGIITTTKGSFVEDYYSLKHCHKQYVKSEESQPEIIYKTFYNSYKNSKLNKKLFKLYKGYETEVRADLEFTEIFFSVLVADPHPLPNMIVEDVNELKR